MLSIHWYFCKRNDIYFFLTICEQEQKQTRIAHIGAFDVEGSDVAAHFAHFAVEALDKYSSCWTGDSPLTERWRLQMRFIDKCLDTRFVLEGWRTRLRDAEHILGIRKMLASFLSCRDATGKSTLFILRKTLITRTRASERNVSLAPAPSMDLVCCSERSLSESYLYACRSLIDLPSIWDGQAYTGTCLYYLWDIVNRLFFLSAN